MSDISAIMHAQLRANVEGSRLIQDPTNYSNLDETTTEYRNSSGSIVTIFYFCIGFIMLLLSILSQVILGLVILVTIGYIIPKKLKKKKQLQPRNRGNEYFQDQI